MRHLFVEWEEVARQVKRTSHVFLLSDFDGTLAPITERPEEVRLSEKTRLVLGSLAKNERLTLGIISGRALNDLVERVAVNGIMYAGNHGLEIRGKGFNFIEPVAEGMRSVFRVLHHALSIALRGIEGVFVENKGLTLSIHYRMADDAEADRVREIVDRVTAPLNMGGAVRLTSGKKVYEIRPPVPWDKGKAIDWLFTRYGSARLKGGPWPVFLGDDVTDEDGFAVVNRRRGLSVFVGTEKGTSRANHYLSSPDEVEDFLVRLNTIL